MEDEDEFGDLYTDVLRPFSSSSGLQSDQHHSRSEPDPPPIENIPSTTTNTNAVSSDDEHCAPSNSNSSSNRNFSINLNTNPNSNRNHPPSNQTHERNIDPSRVCRDSPPLGTDEIPGVSANWPTDSSHVEASETRVLESHDFDGDAELMEADHEGDRKFDHSSLSKDVEFVDKDDNWGLQVEQGDDGPVIPGISIAKPKDSAQNSDVIVQEEVNGQGDDWESDSDDDLQILVNDSHRPDIHHNQGPMFVDGDTGKVDDDDDEDEDGDPLVIVSDTDAVHHPPQEEQGWGEDAGQTPDGERKEIGEAGKANGGVSLAPKIGYSNYGYHPFHSQFKYVRPGAAPLPGGSGGPGQVRPAVNMGAVGGRGRGDWRPTATKGASLQKGYSGFWGSNVSGRGFGGDFTLPSQKTSFDIDIDSFEEKPWKYPGADVSDFFNFSLNEDSWKEYCKQLEQLRMASTMKNKAHVLVVDSRNEQEYDPDLPPELAAAAGIQDPSAENSIVPKADVAQSDIAKGTAYMRPPLPTGRPIPVQVETGSGERLPSVDTRLSRTRDSDAVIVIVLQDSLDDDSSAGDGAADRPDNDDVSREDLRDDAVEEDGEQIGNEYSDGLPVSLDHTKRDDTGKRSSQVSALSSQVSALHDNIPEEESSLPLDAAVEHYPGSRENSPVHPSDKLEASHKERGSKVKAHERSHSTSLGESALDDKLESNESMEGEGSPHGVSSEERVASDNEPFQTDGNGQKQKGDVNSSGVAFSNSLDATKHHSMRKLKMSSQVEHMETKETAGLGYLKAARSSDNSRATGSSCDHQKGLNVVDEEVIQDECSSHARDLKSRRKDHDGSLDTEKNNMLLKRREGSYPHRDQDPYSPHSSHVKSDGFDRRKEREYADGMLQQRGEDPHGRKFRAEESRKHEHADGLMLRHRGKAREGERSSKDEHFPSRKMLENGNWRGNREKDAGLHQREKDDILKTRYETVDDPHSKRRKDDEHTRRDHIDKDEVLRAHRENNSRRKRERDESLDQRKRDDQHRRENTDDHRSVRSKDEGWLQRERVERHRERDDWHRSKQSYEDSLSRREREDGRAAIRSGRNVEDKGWMGHSRKDEYKGYERDNSYKDPGRNGDQLKRKDRVEDTSLPFRGNEDARKDQFGYEEKRSRQEKSTVRSDRAVHASDNRRVHERKPKESSRKAKELEGGQQSTSNSSKKPQEERSGKNVMAGVIGTSERGHPEGIMTSGQLQTNRVKLEDASSDDEQHGSKRGRSKLERWTSHKERDFCISTKPSSSLKFDAEKDNLGSGHSAKAIDEPAKKSHALDSSHSATEWKQSGVPEEKEADAKPMENRHMDTVAKLKKRSERFKLPMPSEKDATSIKKMESEPLSSAPSEAPPNSEMKQERPARKRRWVSK